MDMDMDMDLYMDMDFHIDMEMDMDMDIERSGYAQHCTMIYEWLRYACKRRIFRKKPASVVFQSKIVRTQDPHLALFHRHFTLTKAPENSSW